MYLSFAAPTPDNTEHEPLLTCHVRQLSPYPRKIPG